MNFEGPGATAEEDVFQVTAMVDVVFILLAFFVLSVQFTGGERDLPVGATEAAVADGARVDDLPSEILIELRRGPDGAPRARLGSRLVDGDPFDGITAHLTEIDVPSIPVVLLADPALRVQDVTSGVDAVLASPMTQLSLGMLDGGAP